MNEKQAFDFWNAMTTKCRCGNVKAKTAMYVFKRTHLADVAYLGIACACGVCEPQKE